MTLTRRKYLQLILLKTSLWPDPEYLKNSHVSKREMKSIKNRSKISQKMTYAKPVYIATNVQCC